MTRISPPVPEDAVVTEATLTRLADLHRDPENGLRWPCPFVLPPWLVAWHRAFGGGAPLHLREVRRGGALLGIAPLARHGTTVCFLGDPDVCDYQDVVIVPGRGREFFAALLECLRREGILRLDLGPVRPDSAVAEELVPLARELGLPVAVAPAGVDVELKLPTTVEGYLEGLGKKARHEIRRKLRRLETRGPVRFRPAPQPTEADRETFFRLFRSSRPDKAAFLTPTMERYFAGLLDGMGEAGLLDLSFLEIEGEAAAAVLCFGHGSSTYLYNNGHDRRYASLSVGFLSKVMSIQESIRRGRSRYDLLQGDEPYKLRLGGKAVPLLRCRVDLEAVGGEEAAQ